MSWKATYAKAKQIASTIKSSIEREKRSYSAVGTEIGDTTVTIANGELLKLEVEVITQSLNVEALDSIESKVNEKVSGHCRTLEINESGSYVTFTMTF